MKRTDTQNKAKKKLMWKEKPRTNTGQQVEYFHDRVTVTGRSPSGACISAA